MLRLITAAAALMLAAAPAMAQYVATPYGNHGMMLQPGSGPTGGYAYSPPPQPTFVIPNVQFQQQPQLQQRPQGMCPHYAANGNYQTNC